jgi:hypothetical protein
VHASSWASYLEAKPLTLCAGHSTVTCAMREPPRVNAKSSGGARGFFCWIRRAYYLEETHSWHAFCNPTTAWSGDVEASVLVETFSKQFNHFCPNAVAKNVRPYLSVHRMSELPAHLSSERSSGEVAYLLNGDHVTRPTFNPWHAMADLVNFFIARRMLAEPRIGGPDGPRLSANVSVYPIVGVDGMAPGRGDFDVWEALATGTVHPAPAPPNQPPPRTAAQRFGMQLALMAGSWRQKADYQTYYRSKRGPATLSAEQRRALRPLAAVVLSPPPSAGPWWGMPGPSFRDCPHRSSVLHDFRREATARLDATLPAVRGLLRKMARPRPFNGTGMSTRARATLAGDLYALQSATGSSQRTAPRGAVKQPRLIFVMQRSSSRVDINQTRNCRRCLWNIDELTRALAAAHPSALVVRANPGELSFQEQCAPPPRQPRVSPADDAVPVGVRGRCARAVLIMPSRGSPSVPLQVRALSGRRRAGRRSQRLVWLGGLLDTLPVGARNSSTRFTRPQQLGRRDDGHAHRH